MPARLISMSSKRKLTASLTTVASALPAMPRPSGKMKIGVRIVLSRAPATMQSME